MTHALIIDDNAKNIDVLARLLGMEGVSCTTVPKPAQLASVLENVSHIDVVFLDLEMPGNNGYEVLAKLRADKRFDSVPIIAYTVHVSELHTAHQIGFNGFIGKPLDPDKFPDQLARILKGQPVWETP
jgi:two-component system, cell cycle response regulator DivK